MTVEDYYQKGVEVKDKNPKKAFEFFEKAVKNNPNHLSALNELGNLFFDTGNIEKAREKYLKCLKINPNYLYALHNLGNTFIQEDPEEAIKYFKKALDVDNRYVNSILRWGDALENSNKTKEAREKFEESLNIDPENRFALLKLGISFQKEQPKKAIHYFKKLLELDKNNIDALNRWGIALENFGDVEEARKKYQECLEIDPNYIFALRNLGISFRQKDPKKAIYYFERVLNLDHNDIDVLNRWGIALEDLGNLKGARKKYQECLDINPRYKFALRNLGLTFMNEDTEKATDYFKRALVVDNKYVDALFDLGLSFEKSSKIDLAKEKYKECLKLKPDFLSAYQNLGRLSSRTNPEKGIYYFKKAIGIRANEEFNYYGFVDCIRVLKQNNAFISQFEEIVRQKNEAYGYRWLGKLYFIELRDHHKSIEAHKKSNELRADKDDNIELSSIYYHIGDIEKSVTLLDELLDELPKNEIEDNPNQGVSRVYALHNKAHYLFKMGNYEMASKTWGETLRFYNEGLSNNKILRNHSGTYLNLGNIHFEIFGNLDDGEKTFLEGLKLDRSNLGLLVALNRLYAEKDKVILNPELSSYWKRNSNLRKIEDVFNKEFYTEEEALLMAEIYLVEERFEKALGFIDSYLEAGTSDANWHNLKGQIHMAKEEFSKAVTYFKSALKLENHNLALGINLGNAHLKNKNFASAETEFKKILKRDPNNVDAIIGLGEINLNRSSDGKDQYHLTLAEKQFEKAITLGKSQKGSIRLDVYAPKGNSQERKYKDIKLSDLYYSLGYIKTKQYEQNAYGLGNTHLEEAKNYFSLTLQSNPDHVKATNAKDRIENSSKSTQSTSKSEKIGAVIVTAMAFVIFVLGQYFFYFHNYTSEKYTISQKGIDYISEISSMNEKEIQALNKIKGLEFEEKTDLMSAISNAVDNKKMIPIDSLMNGIHLSTKESVEDVRIITPGYYVLISFGAILFMVAGLYIHNLLKLKVGVIEIEKNSPSQIVEISQLGIQKSSSIK